MMNNEELLALLANEVDQLDKLAINDSLKKLSENRLSSDELLKLHALAESDPELKLAIDAHLPLGEDFFLQVEQAIEESSVDDSIPQEIRSSIENNDDQSHQETSNKKHHSFTAICKFLDWIRDLTPWTLGSAVAATLAFITISLSMFQNDSELPAYQMEIEGGNQIFRGSKSTIDSIKETNDRKPEGQLSNSANHSNMSGRKITIYPDNQLTIFLRPAHTFTGSVEEKLYLFNKNQSQELWGQISRSTSGAIKITIKQDDASHWNAGESQLVAVIAQKGFLPDEKYLNSLLNNGTKNFTSEHWQLLSHPLVVKK